MWLLRFHLIESRDYNRVERFCRVSGFQTKKYASMLLMKGVLLHVLQKKSWRQIGKEIGIPHIPVYNFYSQIGNGDEFREIILYFIERRIVLFLGDERDITREYLETREIIDRSLEKLRRMD